MKAPLVASPVLASVLLVAGGVALPSAAQVAGLSLAKEFTDDPVAPGGTVTLEFTVTNSHATDTAIDMGFTDDLDAALSGLVAVGLPATNVCGAGSQISGTSLLTFSGGSLGPGATCTFQVTLQVPAGAPAGGSAVNTTSILAGTLGDQDAVADPASDTLLIQALSLSKDFDGPVGAGGTVVLSFQISNAGLSPATDVSFVDDLDAVLSGLVAVGLPAADVCGAGSQISGTSVIALTGGSVAASGSCTIDVTLQVPMGAASGSYPNTTSDLFASGLPAAEPAAATLQVEPPPTFDKVFAPDTVEAGEISTLTFTVDNTASALAASGLDFTDNLPAGVVVASPANASTTCTGGTVTAVAGTGVISYTGGAVAAGATCTVQADVATTTDGTFVNTSSTLTSSSGSSGTATDTLTATPAPAPGFSKSFAPATVLQGGVTTLTFTVDNTAAMVPASNLSFVDSLPSGMVIADPADASTTCTGGTLTADPGGDSITYSGGTVAAGASCTVQADVLATAPGDLANTTGDLDSSLGGSGTASATLQVQPSAIPATGASGALLLVLLLAVAGVWRLVARG